MKKDDDDPFAIRFCQRVKAIREQIGMSQRQMAVACGISLDNYKKYEVRTPLPHRYVERFSTITGVSVENLFNLDMPVNRLALRRMASPERPNKAH